MDNLITQSTILARSGWSRTLVGRLLGEPDLRKKMRGRRHPACLYALERVEQAEKSHHFSTAQGALTRRRTGSRKAVVTKITKLLAAVEAMPVHVKRLDQHALLRRAVAAYNARNWRSDSVASLQSDKAFLDRICVNFVRHQLTAYDTSLAAVAGKTGIDSAVAEIRRRIYDAIADAYPALAEECARQWCERL